MSEQDKKSNSSKLSRGVKNGVICRKELPVGEEKRYYDVFEPENAALSAERPVILYAFPDLFEKTPRKARNDFCMRLAADGYKIIVGDYGDNRKKYIGARDAADKVRSLVAALSANGELGDGKVIVFADGSGSLVAAEYVLKAAADESNPVHPVAAVSFDGLYDLRNFVLADGNNRLKAKAIRAFTGEETRQGVIPENIAIKIREISVSSLIDDKFPPLFFAHSAADNIYRGQGDVLGKALRAHGNCFREYKAKFLTCKRGWQFGTDTAAKSLQISLGEFIQDVLDGKTAGSEYIEI